MSHSSPRRAVVTLPAKILVASGAVVFAISFYPNIALGNDLAGDLLELAGTAALVAGANLVVRRLVRQGHIVRLFLAGSAFLVLARTFDFLDEVSALSGVPILGASGLGHQLSMRGSESFGYICLLITMLFMMYELARLNEQAEGEKLRYKELFQSSQYLARLVDLSTDAVFAVNGEGAIQLWNAGARRSFGYTREEAMNRTFRDVLVAGVETVGDNLVRWLEQKGPQEELEVVGLRADGTRFLAGASFSPVADGSGKAVGACIIVRSIEERKRTEQELAASRNLLAGALQAADVGLFIVDRHGDLIEFNARLAAICGLNREDVTDLKLSAVLSRLLKDPDAFRTEIEDRVLRQGQQSEFRNLTLYRPDGEARICNGAVTPVCDESGVVLAAAGVVVDVTEREALHAKLLEVQKMDSIGRLAGGIAHDFNNIMAGVLGYATLVRQELGPDSPHSKRMDAIAESAMRASELTNQLLTFAQAGVRNMETLSLNDLVRETVSLLSHTFDPNIHLHFSPSPDLEMVKGDRAQIHQILMNLCLNSRDAMEGRGEIRISVANVNVDDDLGGILQVAARGSFVRLAVEDTGCGMPPDVVRRMFDPFFSTKKQGQANGLGLSVVYGIVQSHGGGVRVESQVGEGTRIEVYLPSAGQGVQAEAPAPAQPAPAEDGKALILVVDDEKLIRTLFQDILGMAGYRVIEASTGEEGIEIYEQRGREIALIVLDIVMPGMGGAKALEILTKINPELRCIISSGYGSEAIEASLLNHEHIRFMAKPFHSANVISTVRELLEA